MPAFVREWSLVWHWFLFLFPYGHYFIWEEVNSALTRHYWPLGANVVQFGINIAVCFSKTLLNCYRPTDATSHTIP
jgi:hypothetical protein